MSSFTVLTLLVCSCVILVDAGRSLYTSTTSASASTPQMVKASSTKVGSKTVYNVTWAEVKPNSYETIAAKCGDEVIFNWSGHTHDVGIATDGKCDKIEPLTPRSSSGSFRVVLDNKVKPIKEDGEVYFACSVGDHCADGNQIINFYVDCETNSTMGPMKAPAPAPGPGMKAVVAAQG